MAEQQSIATYLDQKCGEIDELITLQEEMITKLQSYKQSVITEAVTKGLDKNVPLKDSGIEWIGEIPEHWKITKIQYLAQLKSGYNLTTEEIKDSGLYPVYGGNGIRWKSHATLTLLAKQDLPTFGYNMIDPLKPWCWGSILFYPFKISRFS